MRPILVDFGIDLPLLGPLNFPSYFTALALSFVIGMWAVRREAPHLGLDRELILDMCLWIVVWAVIGARIFHVLFDEHLADYLNLCLDPVKVKALDAKVATCAQSAECGWDYVCDATTRTCHPPRDCLAIFKVWRGGLVYYGGFVFAAAYGLWFARKHKLGMWKVADLCAPWIAFGLFLTRVGCFLNGCCHGKLSDAAWAVRFPRGGVVYREQIDAGLIDKGDWPMTVHPTQLYLAALNLLTFALLYFAIRTRKKFHGQVFAWLLIMKGVFRSIVEVWRDDERGVLFGWLSTSQIVSVPLVAIGVWLLVRRTREPVTPAGMPESAPGTKTPGASS